MSRVVLVHGFTQTGRSWDPFLPALEAAGHEVRAPDVPVGTNLWDTAGRLADAGGTGHWVGYSMGGRLCLHVALAHRSAVRRLVLVSATGGIDDPGARARRRAADEELAGAAERDGVDAFLERWLARPLFAGLAPEAAGLEERRSHTAPALAAVLRLLGTGSQEPLWGRLGELAMPVLVVVGERDAAFTALGRRMVEGMGTNASLAVVPGAGHACHLEQPAAFLDAVLPFLAAE
jgi:2-succinyl-6-hydroxy-2,4-cyclohexadiene-1-carboxylate synthase